MERKSKENYLLMLRERQKRLKNDPLKTWIPFPKQKAFIDSVLQEKYNENWFVASNRSGKSDAGSYIGSTLARFGNPNARYVTAQDSEISVRDKATSGWVVSLSFPFSRDVIQPKYFNNGFSKACTHPPFIPERELVGGKVEDGWRVSDQILKLKNGSIIGFKSCEAGEKKFQGAEKDWIQFDEVPPKAVYEEATLRVAAGRKLIIFGTCTLLPEESGSDESIIWLYNDIIQPVVKGELTTIGLFGSSIYENKALLPSEIHRLEAKYPPGSMIYRIRLMGEWLPGLMGALAYPSYNYNIHVRPQTKYSSFSPLIWTWDFNVEPMVSLVGQYDNGTFRVLKELFLESGSVFSMVDFFRTQFPAHEGGVWIYGDAMGHRRTAQTGMSDYQMILNAMKGYSSPVTLKVPAADIPIKARLNAVNVALKDEFGRSSVQIDPSCKELIKDLEGVLLDVRGNIKKSYKKKDAYFMRTHTSDALGYWIFCEHPVTEHTFLTGMESESNIIISNPTYFKNDKV